MKILGLNIKNIRKLRAIEMQFSENGLIPIVGHNEAGKTSVLDSMEILIRGMKYSNSDIITHGEERAEIIGQIGEYTIKRVVTKASNRLEITNKDGLQVSGSPQKFLDSLINEITFDPRPFTSKNGDQKLKFMMDLFTLNFDELNKQISELEDERRLIGREGKELGGEKEIPEKTEAVDIVELSKELEAANTHNTFRNQNIKDREIALKNIRRLEEELRIAKEYFDALPKVEDEIPTEELRSKLESANLINAQAKEYADAVEHNQKVEKKRDEYRAKTKEIETLRQKKSEQLKSLEIPVEGLEIREDGVYHNDIYSENWSDSEAMRISSELCLAMNPKLKAIFIDKGESYDTNQLKSLKEWAESNDIQAFITIVDDIPSEDEGLDPNTFYIVEGEIRSSQSTSGA